MSLRGVDKIPLKGSRSYALTLFVLVVDRLRGVVKRLDTSLPIIPLVTVHLR